jgi:serine/threonine protein kinase
MQERDLFIAALEIDDPAARQEYLDKTCGDDPVLHARIQRLLNRVTESADFLDQPAADLCSDFADELLPQAHAISKIGDSPTVVGEINDTAPSQFELPPQLLATQFDDENGVATRGEIDRTSLAPGALFGRYRIECVLGSGGMGVVYLARDTRLNRQVALKIPRFDSDGKLRLIERFRREARVMASVEHRNLCPIINVDEHDGRHYLTMAYINGKPLSQLIKNGSCFPAVQIAEWIRKLAMALDAAHRAGVVHRDLKPANIIIDESGEPILMDFGLAWMAHETDSRVTIAGAIIGTPAYMSPEQAECEPDRVGAASDIYSLGAILYELLAGCPIRTGSVTRVLYKLMHETPLRPSEIRSGVDLRLEEICWRAIARRPDDRFGTAADFAEAISRRHVSSVVPVAVLPSAEIVRTVNDSKPRVIRSHRKRIAKVSALLFGILGFAAFVIQRNVQSPLTGSGQHLPLAPIGHVLAAVNFKYAETTTGFTGTWSANAMPPWQGTFTAEGLRPASDYYSPDACRHDFSELAGSVLPVGTYFTIFSLNQNERITLKAYDSAHTVISSPWLNRKPLSQWGNGSGAGFPGLPVLEDMPGWDWNQSTGTYTFDGKTQNSLTIALSSCKAIGFLDVTRGSNGFSFGLMAPAIDQEGDRFDAAASGGRE